MDRRIHLLLLAVTSLLSLLQLAACDSSCTQWRDMKANCFENVVPLQRVRVRNIQQCVLAANPLTGHLVAEWNRNTGQCSVFHYQSVCHLIHAAAGAAEEAKHCTVFARLPVKDIDALNAINKLRAAWLFDAESGAESENLVCGDRKQWQSEAVGRTKEGAVLDGTSSKMTLNNADFGDMSLGFTWLLRLKRQPRRQILMEHFDCDASGLDESIGAAFWEGQANRPLYWAQAEFTPSPHLLTYTEVLTADANKFINIGITGVPSADSYSIFYDAAFLPPSQIQVSYPPPHYAKRPKYHCYTIGWRSGLVANTLQGTVRAVAIANGSMTEAEISSFFDLVG